MDKQNRGGEGHPRGENGWSGRDADEVWTPEGKERALANLQPQPWGAQTHGLFTWTTRGVGPICNKCPVKDECPAYADGARCRIAAEKLQALVEATMKEPHIQQSDMPTVVEYARAVVGLDIAALHLDAAGPFLPGADKGFLDVQPAQQWRLKLAALELKLAAELGLTPMARHRLKSSIDSKGAGATLAAALGELAQQEAEARKAGAVDADFTAEEPAEE